MDPKEREEKYRENLQGRVLAEYVRITNISIRMNIEFSLMINRIIDMVGYHERLREDPCPLTWLRASGIGASSMAISESIPETGRSQLLDISLQKQKEDGTLALGPLNLPGLEPEKGPEKEPEKESTVNESEN